jgi:hypothetical protein
MELALGLLERLLFMTLSVGHGHGHGHGDVWCGLSKVRSQKQLRSEE